MTEVITDLKSTNINVETASTYEITIATQSGPAGPVGPAGPPGPEGTGVPIGGSTNQVLAKLSNAPEDTGWVDVPSGEYTNATPVPVTIGGIEAGSTFNDVDLTAMFTELLYPYQFPAFSAFSISGQATSIEVGTAISGSKTFNWTTTNSANVTAGSISISDQSGVLDSGLNNTGSDVITLGSYELDTPGAYAWTIAGTDTESNNFTRNFTVNWLWREYYGTSTNTTLSASDILSLANDPLASVGTGTFAFASGGYKYICYPTSMAAASGFTDTSTQLSVSMADSSDDAAYSNVANGFSYAIVSVTNGQGQTTNYRVYRTKFVLGGSITIKVT